jgi:uncharacterized protein involved in outer membrane biogenesis
MKRLARAIEFLAWALFFAAAVLVLAVRFWLLPDVERYRDRIVLALSATIGQPVRIGGIEARWFGLNPYIRLRDVRIYDHAGREALGLPSIENRLAWSSLLRGEIKVHSLAIDGLRVQVRRDAGGALYVADHWNNRVQKLSSSGEPLAEWGSYGVSSGHFNNPRAVAVDERGDVYVSDSFNHRVQKLSSTGMPLMEWGGRGGTAGQFRRPEGLAVDGHGGLVVVDADNVRLQRYVPTK